jgi:HAD superfamily hydrolase (TIGR01509 family)
MESVASVTNRARSSLAAFQFRIPNDDFAGYIFDLDGTLVDTMPLHFASWEAAMRNAGLIGKLDESHYYALNGIPSREVATLLGVHHRISLDPVKVYKEKEELFKQSPEKPELIAAVVEFARSVSLTHPIAVASGGTRDVVQSTFDKTGLAPLFPVVVTADDVEHGKPAPDMFLLAARLMNVQPERCLVFEDGAPGISAAKAAGMKWVLIPSARA